MFEYIKGKLTFISPYYIVIEAFGIGYQIAVANPFRYSSFYENELKLFVHQVIRDDAHTLYGFVDLEEKLLFLRLISVSGIGPKSGIAIMAGDDLGGLIHAIESEDAAYLTRFPGVGKKTAQQMILDLKGKLGELSMSTAAVSAMASADSNLTQVETNSLLEALEALEALGYSTKEVKRIKPALEKLEDQTTDQYLRQGLKLLMKK